MSTRHPQQPYNRPEMFVVSMDIGTTQSAVSFAHLVPGILPQVKTVTYWPGQAQSAGTAKVPTILSYRAGVMQSCGEAAIPDLEAGYSNVAQWFKLHLHPSTMARPSPFEVPDMPPGVSVARAYRDMIKYLMDHTQKFFERTTPNGEEIWKRLRDEMIIILATPNGWDFREHSTLRTAAVKAEIVSQENMERSVRFIPEAEAAVHYALAHYQESWLEKNTTFAVVDAGGSTIDITIYKCALTKPLRIHEVYPSECVQAGGIFVNRAVENLLYDRLRGSDYDDPVIIRDMLNFFEKELKPKFNGSEPLYQIKFGTAKDSNKSLGIDKGKISISLEDLKGAFNNAVDQIIACCLKALRSHRPKNILLVGGFGGSPYLQKALSDKFKARGTKVIVMGDYSRKAAAKGATIGYIKNFVEERAAGTTFGGCVRQLYDRKLHGERRLRAYVDTDGKTRVDNVFHPWTTKGTILKEESVHRLHYHNSWNASLIKKEDLVAQLGAIPVEVYVWEGDEPIPKWCKDENGDVTPGMRLMCTLNADLSALASSLKAMSGNGGIQFYRVEYDVCVYVGGTSLRASLEWREGKEICQGPVAVIPTP